MPSPSEHPEPRDPVPWTGHDGGHDADLPAELPRALRELLAEGTAHAAPEDGDLEFRAAVHRHFRRHDHAALTQRRAWSPRRIAAGIAAASIAAAAALLLITVLRPPTLTAPVASVAPADVNGDGLVDMLDAFALARGLADAGDQLPRHDFNADGTVDDADVDRLAERIVSLDPPSFGPGPS